MDPKLLEFYHEARYVVNAPESRFTIVVGKTCRELDALLISHKQARWTFITAYNPRSQPLTLEENEERQRQLKEALTQGGYPVIDGVGSDPDGSWQEPSLLVIGISVATARELGVRFEQNAILLGERGRPAELLDLSHLL